MNLRYLDRLLADNTLVAERIRQHIADGSLHEITSNDDEIRGHLMKADHNLKFVHDNIGLGYLDWCVTGCYYAAYHAAIALIIMRGYSSKSHDATLCALIQEYYSGKVSAADIELLHGCFLDYQEIVFYVQSKEKREHASYATSTAFDKQSVSELRIKAALFVNKTKEIINNR